MAGFSRILAQEAVVPPTLEEISEYQVSSLCLHYGIFLCVLFLHTSLFSFFVCLDLPLDRSDLVCVVVERGMLTM